MITLFEGEFATRDTLRYIEEKGQIGLWAWDLRSGAMIWSRGMYALLGLERAEVEPSYDIINGMTHPDDRLSPSELEHLITRGFSLSRDFRLKRRGGRVRWIANRGEMLIGEDGRPLRAIGAWFDVTRETEAVVGRKLAEDRLQAQARATGVTLWITRPDGSGGEADWARLTGIASPGQSPDGWLANVEVKDRAACAARWDKAVGDRSVFAAQGEIRHAVGGGRRMQLRAAPILEGSGKIREWVWTALDIGSAAASPLLHDPTLDPRNPPPLSGAQLRGARGCLNWSVRDLSHASGVTPSVIRRLEDFDGTAVGPEPSMDSLRRALEEAGVEFLFPSTGRSGVRLR